MRKNIIKQAERYCKEQGYRYSKPRELILKILAYAQKPLGAYDILNELSKTLDSPKPPTVYRSIQFWLEHGFIHCIESQKAYVICTGNHAHEGLQLLVCQTCGKTEELNFKVDTHLFKAQAQQHHFTIDSWITELKGTCHQC